MKQTEILWKFAEQDPNAFQVIGWRQDVPVCEWSGITCTGDSVSGIILDGQSVSASIPSEFGELVSLTSLSLTNNAISSTFPVDVAKLPLLQSVNIGGNGITGKIPIFTSAAIAEIVLQNNRFSGTLPGDYFAALANLQTLDVSSNNLSGTVSESIGSATSLSTLDLSSNNFVGTLPVALGKLKNLKWFYISSNRFVGTIPRSFSSADSNLIQVWMHQNDLSGTIPATFAEMKFLDDFYVDGNLFTGTVPSRLCRPTLNVEFVKDVYGSNIQGNNTLPQTNQNYWCQRVSCPADTYSAEGVMPCQPCEEGTTTPYLGQHVQCFTTNQDEIIKKLYESMKGSEWSRGATWFYEGFDTCEFTGIRCNKAGHITKIELPSMNMHGSIPYELGFLEHLETLDLSDNYLTGFLPATLANLPLKVLAISGNEIKGPIPPSLCMMPLNGNGFGGEYDCDAIACSGGTYSPTGTLSHGGVCAPCDGDTTGVIGRRQCQGQVYSSQAMSASSQQSSSSSSLSTGAIVGITLAVITGVALIALVGYKYLNKKRSKGSSIQESSLGDEDKASLRYADDATHGRFSDNPEFCDVPILDYPKLDTPESPHLV